MKYCKTCKRDYQNGYFKRHLTTQKHLKIVEDNEKSKYQILLNNTDKYTYDMDILTDIVQEKTLSKNIIQMKMDMDLLTIQDRMTGLRKDIDGLKLEKTDRYNKYETDKLLLGVNMCDRDYQSFKKLLNEWTIDTERLVEEVKNLQFFYRLLKKLQYEIKENNGYDMDTQHYNPTLLKHLLHYGVSPIRMDIFNQFKMEFLD